MSNPAATGKKKRNFNPVAGLIAFAVVFIAVSALCGFSSGGVIGGAAAGLAVGALVGVMGSGLDTTTHNKEDRARKEQEESANVPETGDAVADALIRSGTEQLASLRAAKDAAGDPLLSGLIDELHEKCARMLKAVSESPGKAPRMRKFMNYYLPTTLRILENYTRMKNGAVSSGDLSALRDSSVRGLNLVLTAAQKQLDSLHRENMLDLSADIDVLEQMLKRDGFSDISSPFPPEHETAKARDAAQGGVPAPALEEAHTAPVLEFPVKGPEKQPVIVNSHNE